VFTALRTCDGLNLQLLEQKFGNPFAADILEWAKPHIDNANLTYNNNVLQLTEQGIFVSNDVMSDLMHLEEEEA
jgi:oxygen-independent coproporphyrinogen-3 oxidase